MQKILNVGKIEFAFAREKSLEKKINIQILKERGVIPWDWELSEDSIYNDEMSLLIFPHGVYILGQEDLIACLETVNAEEINHLGIQEIAHNYLDSFPEEFFQAFGINIEGYAIFSDQEMARSQLLKTFFASEAQHKSDQQLIQAVINFIYKLEQGVLTMTVRNTEIPVFEQESISVIKFSANFHHDLLQFPQEHRLQHLHRLINTWRSDLKIYREIIDCKFIGVKDLQFN